MTHGELRIGHAGQISQPAFRPASAPVSNAAPLPNSKLEPHIVGRFADAVEAGDVDGMVALLTDDAWVTTPPEPYEYQGPAAIGAFLRGREVARGAMRLAPTRANGQPAFACYLPSPQTDIARPPPRRLAWGPRSGRSLGGSARSIRRTGSGGRRATRRSARSAARRRVGSPPGRWGRSRRHRCAGRGHDPAVVAYLDHFRVEP